MFADLSARCHAGMSNARTSGSSPGLVVTLGASCWAIVDRTHEEVSGCGHDWKATLSSRAAGSGCPECREAGKSKVELAHHEAAVRIFGAASSGQAIVDEAFTHGARWLVDVTIVTVAGLRVAIEYDGAYWHADKGRHRHREVPDLFAAGWLVARLREHPLSSLGIDHRRYTELVVHASAPDPDDVMRQVEQWTATLPGRDSRPGFS